MVTEKDKIAESRKEIMDFQFLKNEEHPKDPETLELLANVGKLCYRNNILKKSLEEMNEGLKSEINSFDIQAALTFLFEKAFDKLEYLKDVAPKIVPAAKGADYQCPSALNLYQKLKGTVKSAKDIAERVIKEIPENEIIESLIISGPGFINITIKNTFCSDMISDIVVNGVKPPGFLKKTVSVDFSSPNIAKEMHVGHLRSTIIGDTICRLLEFLGCNVYRINHVGDWGTQFGMLIAYMEKKFGSLSVKSSSISDLQVFYKESKKHFDSDEEFKKNAYAFVIKLQSGDPEVRKAWELICDISRIDFQKIYDRLEVTLEECGESFYQDLMLDAVKELAEAGVLVEENNCKIVPMNELKLPPLFVVKSDGGFTYDTSDIATIKYRLFDLKSDWILYVVDSGQADHFKAIFEAAQRMKWYDPELKRVEHIGFGVVLGADKKKFKTRSGETVKLSNLLDEGVERCKNKLSSKDPPIDWTESEIQQTSEKLAYACIRYSDLSHHRTLDYVFSYDKMLEDRGNTAIYLLYASTRIKAIMRKCNLTPDSIKKQLLESETGLKLEHPAESKLAKKIVRFPSILKRMADELLPHQLCEYTYELCTIFMEFYEKCQCVNKDPETGESTVDLNRLSLVCATQLTLEKCFKILGITTSIERM